MDSLTARGLNKHFSLNISFENSTCSNRAALPAMEYYYSGRVDGFLGLPVRKCSQVVQYSGFNWVRQRMNMKADYFDTNPRNRSRFTEEEITNTFEAENQHRNTPVRMNRSFQSLHADQNIEKLEPI
uniref:Leishmanolysin-like peptidase n=1 Tax=Macrostomum lignano TaxID=282301 RepID=A0A1I8IZ53_9PLAT